jgi:hypothetical protein
VSGDRPDALPDLAIELLAIAQRARRITAEPSLHESDLDGVLDDVTALQLHTLPADAEQWTQAMMILSRSVSVLIGAAQLELAQGVNAASRRFTESKREEVERESRPVHYVVKRRTGPLERFRTHVLFDRGRDCRRDAGISARRRSASIPASNGRPGPSHALRGIVATVEGRRYVPGRIRTLAGSERGRSRLR